MSLLAPSFLGAGSFAAVFIHTQTLVPQFEIWEDRTKLEH